MSLVVAGIHDGHITMVADTKVTFTDRSGHTIEDLTRDTYFRALPKIVMLRRDLIVGVTGDDPDRVIESLLMHRASPIEEVLDHLAKQQNTAFVVAALNPVRLWLVADGDVENRTTLARAWAGNGGAYEIFQAKYLDPGMRQADTCFKLMSSMQHLTSFNPVKSVGGTTMRATSNDDGFQFMPMFTRVMPPYMEVEFAAIIDGNLKVTLVVPPGGDPTTYQVIVVPGAQPTFGSVGLLIPETGKGLVFPHETPWEAGVVAATTVQELVDSALAKFRQTLVVSDPPPGHR